MNSTAAKKRHASSLYDRIANKFFTHQKTGLAGQQVYEKAHYYAGQKLNINIRHDTNDIALVDLILTQESEYRIPIDLKPQVIIDAGANIGITSLYYALTYPDAKLFSFEPLPDNIELLEKNTAPYRSRIQIIPKGISDVAGQFSYHMSNDPQSFGGGTFQAVGHNPQKELQLPVVSSEEALRDLNITEVDIFKIDTEGSEWKILKGLPEKIRHQTKVFIGELHSVNDWDFCNMLQKTHAIGIQKRYHVGCYPFIAIRRDLA